ncbi:hypothetical protein K0B04_02255 [Patescibacteria group bacterium]|nr:hypothetical protein [Patescibacteria group bacterium]
MTPSNSLKSPTRISERALRNRLKKRVYAIFIIIGLGVVSLFFFAPQVGSLFGYFSKYRNDPGYVPTPKPMPPVFIDSPEAINQDKITLTGRALPGNTVKIYVNGPEKGTDTAGSDGLFTFSDIKLNLGTNTIFAKAFDDKGQESDSSEFLIINYDNKAPIIEIENIENGDTVKNLNNRIEISGKVNEKATITINEKSAIQKSDLTFYFVLGVKEGDVEIKIEAEDLAGNKTVKELKVKYVKGS